MRLYRIGADYVLTPHFLGGDYLADMITHIKTDSEGYKKEREKHIKTLLERLRTGQRHPNIDND